MPDQFMAEVVSAPIEVRTAAQTEAFVDSTTGRELKHLSDNTIPLNLRNLDIISSPILREKAIAGAVNGFLEDLQVEGAVLSDLKGNVAVAYPNIDVVVGGGLNRLQKNRLRGQVSGLTRDSQQADFWRAALRMSGFNWRAAETEFGIKSPEEAKKRLQELQDRAPERVASLTNLLFGREPEKKSSQDPLIKVGRNATILPAAQYAQVEERLTVKAPKTTVQKVLPMLAVVGLGVALSSCASSPIEAGQPTLSPEQTGGPTSSAPTAESIPQSPTATPEFFPDYEVVFNNQNNMWEVQNQEGEAVAQQTQEAGPWQINYEQLAQDERINPLDANTFPEQYKNFANFWLEEAKVARLDNSATNEELDARWEDYQQFVEAARQEFFEKEGIADEVAAIKDINPELQSLWGMIYWIQNNRDQAISQQIMPVVTPAELRIIMEQDSGSIVDEEDSNFAWTEDKIDPDGTKAFSATYGYNSAGLPSHWHNSNEVGSILGRDNIQTKHDPGPSVWGDIALITQISPNDTSSALVLSHLKTSQDRQETIRHKLVIRFVSFDESFILSEGSYCGGWDNEENQHYAMELPNDIPLGPLVTSNNGEKTSLENLFNNLGANVNFGPPIKPLGGVEAYGCIDPNLGLEIAARLENRSDDISKPFSISDQAWPWQSQAGSVERTH